MKKEGWLKLIKESINNDFKLNLLAELLTENDEAKQLLIEKGYSCTGMSMLETINNLPD